MSAAEIIPLRTDRQDLARLVHELKALAYERAGGMSITEVIGAFEMAKLEILSEQQP